MDSSMVKGYCQNLGLVHKGHVKKNLSKFVIINVCISDELFARIRSKDTFQR